MVDSGCMRLAFIDFKFAVCNNIPLFRLVKKKPLYLADSVLLSWIEWGVGLRVGIGAHQEQLEFYITSLVLENLVILSLP
jgi:hypothetical protein